MPVHLVGGGEVAKLSSSVSPAHWTGRDRAKQEEGGEEDGETHQGGRILNSLLSAG